VTAAAAVAAGSGVSGGVDVDGVAVVTASSVGVEVATASPGNPGPSAVVVAVRRAPAAGQHGTVAANRAAPAGAPPEVHLVSGAVPGDRDGGAWLAGPLERAGVVVHRPGTAAASGADLGGWSQPATCGVCAAAAAAVPEAVRRGPRPVVVLAVVVDDRQVDAEATALWTVLAEPVRASVGDWWRAQRARRVLLAAPRSFCAGVERAIEIVERAIERFGAPVHVRRQIVHNEHVVAELERRGAVFVQELDEVPDGATVVLAAHGVAPAVRATAEARGLRVVDATCPLVAKVHREARRFAAEGRRILLIGHADHEEVEGTVGEAPELIDVVGDVADVDELGLEPETPVAYLTQTTLAVDETEEVVAALKDRFTDVVGPAADDICYATQNRQDAVRSMAPACDLVLVVGSTTSSNTARLVEVARRQGTRAELVEDATSVELRWLADATTVGVTAGASAPERVVQEVVQALGALGPVSVSEHRTTEEHVRFALPQQVR
jgi:4-hydroxy-3-methylbut-2-enyl diphosphate reductase